MATHTFLFFMLLLVSITLQAQHTPDGDWANLTRYQNENKKWLMKKSEPNRVVFMGNSITEGWLHAQPEFFADKPYINRGISGQTTPQMLLRFRQDVVALKPRAVVILAGTNDIAGNTGVVTIQQIMDNIASMAELAKVHHIEVILCSVLPAFDYPWRPGLAPAKKIMELNLLIQDYCNKNNCLYLDYWTPMADEKFGLKKIYGDDGVHPNQAGYNVMAPLAEQAIKKALTKIGKR